MSVETLALVLHHSRSKGTDKLILIGIANHDGDGGAWPAVKTLARYAHVDESTVRRSLRRLEGLGELLTHTQAGGPSGIPEWRRPNRYEVLIACPATCDRTKNHREITPPQAPADLWITGGAPTPGGRAHAPGVGAPTRPAPQAPTRPEPYIEPNLNTRGVVDDLTTEGGPCSICSRPEHDCRSRVATSGHEYAPKRLRSVR